MTPLPLQLLLVALVLLPYAAAFQCFDDNNKPYTCSDGVRYCVKDQKGNGEISRFCSGDGGITCNTEQCSHSGDFCCCGSNLCNSAPATHVNAVLLLTTALCAAVTVLFARY